MVLVILDGCTEMTDYLLEVQILDCENAVKYIPHKQLRIYTAASIWYRNFFKTDSLP